MLFRVARSRDGGNITHFDLYKVEVTRGMTVLDALFQIQDKMDPSLAFRYSCRGAVCGSCALLVNKEPRLACRTQVSALPAASLKLKQFTALEYRPRGWRPDKEVLIEPLPNLPVMKDLVVDMSRFYSALEELMLWTEPTEGEGPREQSPADRQRIDRYVNCIMCAICYGSCPVNAERPDYVGPAALAKAWRFYEDSRLTERGRYLTAASAANGTPLCNLVMNCVRACPKGVAPGGAIRRLKEQGTSP
ncbi:MAG: succinate dehydrogenase/fumarate reductase iron-sulfur subunit [Candidatus Thorarchaeota archaeon]|nr:succinate dehydrogenase/fumarate reductase iron-sulfur subunit [Candidatus Thorarchaeota archaeon]